MQFEYMQTLRKGADPSSPCSNEFAELLIPTEHARAIGKALGT